MSNPRKVAVIVGSLRKESFSRKLAKAIAATAPANLTFKYSAGGYDVTKAVAAINNEIRAALAAFDVFDQETIDRHLIALDGTPDKSRLGGNALIAVSLAVAHAAAAARGVPLYAHLGEPGTHRLPLPEIQLFGGGAHAGRRVDIQDFMVVAVGARSFAEALDMTAEVYRAAGRLLTLIPVTGLSISRKLVSSGVSLASASPTC